MTAIKPGESVVAQLVTTDAQFEALHKVVAKGKSKTVPADRAALVALLIDHGRLVKRCEESE